VQSNVHEFLENPLVTKKVELDEQESQRDCNLDEQIGQHNLDEQLELDCNLEKKLDSVSDLHCASKALEILVE
jgi:hypothetical protein